MLFRKNLYAVAMISSVLALIEIMIEYILGSMSCSFSRGKLDSLPSNVLNCGSVMRCVLVLELRSAQFGK